ncbi:hypothetical protein B0H10DRAFT_1966669 [Mycena sp. CBHHK59/15]|nr:hypothetical protein B0H10DRAFT_1966669 [Mycena sp. CBHHK59/15]
MQMEANGITYVAKRCRKICTDMASFIDNLEHLRNTVSLLHRISIGLEDFYYQAEKHGIEEEVHNCKSFEVQPTFLAEENLEKARPSVASGVSAEALEAAGDEYKAAAPGTFPDDSTPGVFWLIQRYNGKSQDRWNLMRPQGLQPNKIDGTLFAFTHFFWERFGAKKRGYLSQYQSASGKMQNGHYRKLIFDTGAQNDPLEPTRYADDGAEGAQMVQRSHQCNRVCSFFGLNTSNVAGEGSDAGCESGED